MTDVASTQPRRQRYRGMRVLEVLRVQDITPLMRRVTLGGAEIDGIPEGPNLKLVIQPPGATDLVWPVRGADGKPAMPDGRPMLTTRTYSLRRLDRAAGELDVDFVLHGHGIACKWAQDARPGDRIGIGGPGGPEVREADWYLLAGDQTALPAISRILEQLPPHAKGVALIQVPNRSEEQPLDHPPGISLHWLHSDDGHVFEDAVRSLAWPSDVKVYVWMAGESTIVRSLRSYVREEKKLGKKDFLAIGYWRKGLSEPEYHEKFDHDRGEDFYEAIRHELEHSHDQ